jgi:CBS domain-containing protein
MNCRIRKLVNRQVECLQDSLTVQEAAAFMARHDLGSVLVTHQAQVVGLFTEKDLIKRVIGLGKDPGVLTLGEVCSRKLISVHEDTSCEKAIQTMRYNNCRRLLVYRGDTLRGVVTLPLVAEAMARQGQRSNILLNIVGGMTLFVTFMVIGFGLYKLPEMLRFAMTAFQ